MALPPRASPPRTGRLSDQLFGGRAAPGRPVGSAGPPSDRRLIAVGRLPPAWSERLALTGVQVQSVRGASVTSYRLATARGAPGRTPGPRPSRPGPLSGHRAHPAPRPHL
ncbi:protein of unknown function [Streptomyces murinus]